MLQYIAVSKAAADGEDVLLRPGGRMVGCLCSPSSRVMVSYQYTAGRAQSTMHHLLDMMD